jgi:hypothetical protein
MYYPDAGNLNYASWTSSAASVIRVLPDMRIGWTYVEQQISNIEPCATVARSIRIPAGKLILLLVRDGLLEARKYFGVFDYLGVFLASGPDSFPLDVRMNYGMVQFTSKM